MNIHNQDTAVNVSAKKLYETSQTRPAVHAVNLDGIPDTLKARERWVLWGYHWSDKRDAWGKVPLYSWVRIRRGPDGQRQVVERIHKAKSTNPKTWADYESTAAQHLFSCDTVAADAGRLGVGYVLTTADRITMIDLDDCRNPETGAITPEATGIIRAIDSYTEVSNSGTGVKILAGGLKPGTRCKHTARHVEMYDNARYAALTGNHLPGTPRTVEPRQEPINALHAELFPEPNGADTPAARPADPPRGHAGNSTATDAEIIRRAESARNGDQFCALYYRADLSRNHGDRSAADMALAATLAFYCGPDPARVESIMWTSALARDKWKRPGYLAETIRRAISGRKEFWGGAWAGDDGPLPDITLVMPGKKGERERKRKRREAEAAERAARGEAVEAGTNVLMIKTLPEPPADPYAGLDTEGARRAAAQAAEDEAVRVGLVRIANEIHEKKCKKFRCPHPRRPLCHDPRTKTDIMPRVRCANWTCQPCAAYFRDRLKTSIGHHMTDSARPVEWVYVRTIPARAWGRFRKRILRHKKTHGKRYGQYAKLSPDGGTRELEVYTTADVFKHAERLTPQQAKERFHGRMDLCVGFNPRVTTSRGWRLPTERDDKPSGFNRIGEVHPSITGIDLEAFAAKIGGAVESGRAGNDRPGRVMGGTKLLYPKWFNAYQIEWCHWTLRTAMTPEGVDIDDVTGPPPAVPPPEPEIILVPGRRRSGDPPGNGLDLDYVPIET